MSWACFQGCVDRFILDPPIITPRLNSIFSQLSIRHRRELYSDDNKAFGSWRMSRSHLWTGMYGWLVGDTQRLKNTVTSIRILPLLYPYSLRLPLVSLKGGFTFLLPITTRITELTVEGSLLPGSGRSVPNRF